MGNIDSIPIISQVKSLVQVISGDVEGARKTQENFLETAPVVSQVTSLVHVIGGNKQKAKAVQEKFLKNLDETSNGLPIVGHIKGVMHYARGDKTRGDQLMKDATGSFVSMAAGAAGFVGGGPAGAAAASIAASHAYDGIVTGIDTAIHGKNEDGSPRYYGSLSTYDRIGKGKADAGEIFDTVAMTAVEAATGAFASKFGRGNTGGIRCRRDVEYHLTSDEAQFVTSHQILPVSASEVITANWQHLSAPETVSNLVSLFVILRLILWNDKNGRTYSRELCSMTAEYDYIERCQESLMKTLRQMDDNLAKQEEDSEYVFNPALVMAGITDNSTIIMIRSMASLYGILDSMGRGDSMGITWLIELCMYEDLATHGICEEVVLHKLKELGIKAFSLGKARKNRVKRGGRCRLNVGKHRYVQAGNRVKNKKIASRGEKYESNHVPARSSYPGNPAGGSLPAHSLPYNIHQRAMSKIGTSKNSNVAKALRNYESQLIKQGKMAEAIKLDLTASYGRANTKLNVNGKTTSFKPALVTYKTDMKGLVNEHLRQGRISTADAAKLHKFIGNEVNYWNRSKNWNAWMNRMKVGYENIVKKNNFNLDPNMHVPAADIYYG